MAKVTILLITSWLVSTTGTKAEADGSIFEIDLNRREVEGPHPSLRYLRDYQTGGNLIQNSPKNRWTLSG